MRGLRFIYIDMIFLLSLPGTFWAFNPFTPPENVQLFNQIVYPDPTQSNIDYKMYMQSNGKIIALLNSSFVSEGDKFNDMKVVSINATRVILLLPSGEKRVVVIDSMQSNVQVLRQALEEENNTSRT